MVDQILSQDEVDALLSAVSKGKVEVEEKEEEKPPEEGVVPCDLTKQDRIIRGKMPALDIINDRFCRYFRATLSNTLRQMTDVSVESFGLKKFGEFLNTLPSPSCLSLVRFDPLPGAGLISIDPKLLFSILDILFGGTAHTQIKVEGRDYTGIELKIIGKVVKMFLADLATAWKPIHEITPEYMRTEMNPQLVVVVPTDDIIIDIDYYVIMENVKGSIHLVIPYSTIEPIRDKLSSPAQSQQMDAHRGWSQHFRNEVMELEVELKAELGSEFLTVRDVLDLKKGDIIKLNKSKDEQMVLFVEGRPKFYGNPVVKEGGNIAFALTGVVEEKI